MLRELVQEWCALADAMRAAAAQSISVAQSGHTLARALRCARLPVFAFGAALKVTLERGNRRVEVEDAAASIALRKLGSDGAQLRETRCKRFPVIG